MIEPKSEFVDLNQVAVEAIEEAEAQAARSTEQARIAVEAIRRKLDETSEKTGRKPHEILRHTEDS